MCPEIIKINNYNLGGVDKSNQMIASRNWDGKEPGKFYLRLHFDYLEQAMVNVKIAYEANVQPRISVKDFRMALAIKGLVGSANFRERKASLDSNTGTVDHLHIHLPNRKRRILCKKAEERCKSIMIMGLQFTELWSVMLLPIARKKLLCRISPRVVIISFYLIRISLPTFSYILFCIQITKYTF